MCRPGRNARSLRYRQIATHARRLSELYKSRIPWPSLRAGGNPCSSSLSLTFTLLCTVRAQPRVGALAPAQTDLRELPGVTVASTVPAAGGDYPIAGHDHEL